MSFVKNLFRRKVIFDTHSQEGALNRVLGTRDLTLFGIAAIIGAGIFSSIGEACSSGGPGVIWLFIICAVACGFAALCYAEFASRIPVAGSAYTYAYASFGELFAWVIGWALLMEYAIGNIYVAFSWSGYFTHLMDSFGLYLPRWLTTDYASVSEFIQHKDELIRNTLVHGGDFSNLWTALNASQEEKQWLEAWMNAPQLGGFRIIFDMPAVLINVLITWLVFRGIKESRNASNAMVILKILVVVLVIVVGAFYIDIDNFTPFMPEGFKGVMTGVSAVFFTYIGFDAVSTLAEETKNPKRDLPRGMFYSLFICTILYILIALVLTGMVPYKTLGVDDPLAFVLAEKNIKWLEYVVSSIAVVAMASVLLVFQLGQPRIWLSMSRDGLLPPAFSKIHPKFQTPSFATIVTGLVVGIPILFTNEKFVLDFTSIGTLFAFVLVCGGVLLLPKREPSANSGFVLPYINGKWIYLSALVMIIGIVHYKLPSYWGQMFRAFGNESNFETQSMAIFWLFTLVLAITTFQHKLNLIPLLGITACGYLLTGMQQENWFWFIVWFGIGLLFYFSYGFRNSVVLKNQQTNNE